MNGVADSAQKGRVASSVAHLAHQAGIPRILVDIRHESTHNELPSLSVLRVAATQALEWLRTKYWKAQRTCVVDSVAHVRGTMKLFIESHVAAALREIPSGCEDTDGNEETRQNGGDEEYDVRKEKKHRQSLFTELRTSVPKGAEKILVDTIMCTCSESSEPALRKACPRVLTHLLGEWPDLHCMIVRTFFDQRLELNDTIISRIWMEESLDGMSSGNIDAVMVDVMNVYGPLLRQRHIEAFVEGCDDGNLRQIVSRLEETFDAIQGKGSLSPPCRRRLERFAAAFFSMPTTSEALDTMKRINDDNHTPHDLQPVSGWKQVEAWTPCAIGMMPSPQFCMNGRMPDLQLHINVPDTLATPLKNNIVCCPKTHGLEESMQDDSDESLDDISNQDTMDSDASRQQGPPDSSLGACLPPTGLSFKPT